MDEAPTAAPSRRGSPASDEDDLNARLGTLAVADPPAAQKGSPRGVQEPLPKGYRTRLCKHWLASGGTHCPMTARGLQCKFAHGERELRPPEGRPRRRPRRRSGGRGEPRAGRRRISPLITQTFQNVPHRYAGCIRWKTPLGPRHRPRALPGRRAQRRRERRHRRHRREVPLVEGRGRPAPAAPVPPRARRAGTSSLMESPRAPDAVDRPRQR